MSCSSWTGGSGTSLQQILAKTEQNVYGRDWYRVEPFVRVDGIAGRPFVQLRDAYCMSRHEARLAGLTQSQVVAGENEMTLFVTYTRCPGEIDCRFTSLQM
jgi:hypothetical protein